VWEYEEPLAVRRERRRLWEEGRDCARVLHEAGVRFAFGTAREKPGKLLERVRSLVEAGLSADAAEAALSDGAAAILGVPEHLGRVAVGQDATLALWTGDPLADAKAKVRWVFVDGYVSEFPEKKEDKASGKPAEGVDVSGAWSIEIRSEGGPMPGTLTLEMQPDGSTSGKLATKNPMDQSDLLVELSGSLSGTSLELRGTIDLGSFQIGLTLTLEVDGDSLSGQASLLPPGQDSPQVEPVSGRRVPKQGRSVR
jgi:hypothetical protein